jgi:DNA-binding transcriptional MerR regulator
MAHPSVADINPQKSPEAFRTISEVSHELGVAQHVLRFWETKFAQIRPMKRAGGRRYYRPEDVALLKRIHQLLYAEGYTIPGAQKALKGVRKTELRDAAPDVDTVETIDDVSRLQEPANTNQVASITEPLPTRETVVSYRLAPSQVTVLQAALAELIEIKAILTIDPK